MKWYEIKSKGEKAEIWIYDQIGEDFWTGGGVTAKSFQKELAEIKASQIDLHINSPGGVVFDGITIYNLLRQHSATITSYIDGLAASIASVIALAGDKVVMAANALYMIHNPSGMAMGTSKDMRDLADLLDKIAETMVKTYASKTKKTDDELRAMMETETWMTAEEAKELGFIDEIGDEIEASACAKFVPVMSKAGFRNIPKSIGRPLPSEREMERALRDAGCSSKQAKEILAKGFAAAHRDDGQAPIPPKTEPQRDVAPPPPARKSRFADLMIRAEKLAPSTL